MLKISRLTVEHLSQGCVTDEEQPRVSFQIESDRQNVSLKKAKIWVGDWSTETESQILVPYTGKKLNPFTEYPVVVKVMDDKGEAAEAVTSFETGRMGTAWKAQWITDGEYHFTEKKISPKTMTFRKKIACSKKVTKARLYATALGIYEMTLNGEKVGDIYFAPGFTSYKHQLQYQTYDVTEQLKSSEGMENEMIAVVGGGWAVGSFTYKRVNRNYADRQALLCELRITYEDGSEEIIGTDESWEVTLDGAVRETEFYNGEIYDATVDMDKIAWHKASREQVKLQPEILAQYGAPVKAHEVFHPVSVTKAPSGVVIYDFGQNFAGVISAKIKGKKGQKITFRHAEILMDGELFTKPLRSAKQEAVYICRDGEQTWSPRMTYMGFRYVSMEGAEEQDVELSAIAYIPMWKTMENFPVPMN